MITFLPVLELNIVLVAFFSYTCKNSGELAPEKQNQEGKTNLDLLEQEIVSGSGISWAVSANLHLDPVTKPRHHPITQFFQAGCPSYCPINSVKALKVFFIYTEINSTQCKICSHEQYNYQSPISGKILHPVQEKSSIFDFWS